MSETMIAVIGAGGWGTTLAALLAGKGLQVRLWVREAELATTITATRENSVFLPGIHLPETLSATTDMAATVTGAALCVIAVPSCWMRATIGALATQLTSPLPPMVSVTKGLEIETGKRMSEVIHEMLPSVPAIAALSGPNLAPEIARGQLAATVIASQTPALADFAQALFMTPRFRPYSSRDIIGLEICGAVKNVIAIAAGICDGLGYGDNAKAALLTRALAEISRLVQQLGGEASTVAGLSGIGDLMATCASPISRNHRVGLAIGRGEDYRTALGDSGQIAEGVPTTEAVVRLARRRGVEMPICEQVAAILFEGRPAGDAALMLMTREPKGERV